jgi:hypothetical protein
MVLTDTGYWLALANKKDRFHQRAKAVSAQLHEDPVTTWPVVTETCYMLQRDVSVDASRKFLAFLFREQISIFAVGYQHFARIDALMGQYANLPMDLADASLVVLAEELGHGRILSTDQRDFNAYRWKNSHPFTNLLFQGSI